MSALPDSDWYFEHVLQYAQPGTAGLRLPGPAARWQQWWADQDVPDELRRQGFVQTTAQLRARGVSRQRARTVVRDGSWTRPAHGVIAPLDVRDEDAHLTARRRHALAATAAHLLRPGNVVSGRSATVLHGLPVFELPDRPELTRAQAPGHGRRGSAHLYAAHVAAADVTRWFGVETTTVSRTLVDLARHDRRDAIMAADAALREGLASPGEIEQALTGAVGWPGVKRARAVLVLADARAESPLESLARLVMHDDGLPPPDLQVKIGGHRVDMLFRAQRLIVEIDGLGKYTGTEGRREKRRERQLRRLGFRVERLTWDDIVLHWPATRVWLRAALGLPA